MAFMEASASASGGGANGVLTGAGAHGSVGFGRGTRARMCFGRDSVGFGRGTRVKTCFGRDMAEESKGRRIRQKPARKSARASVEPFGYTLRLQPSRVRQLFVDVG